MKVMVQTSLDGCPDSCSKLELDCYAEPMMPMINGELSGVIVTVDCEHCDVCRLRTGEPEGRVRKVV